MSSGEMNYRKWHFHVQCHQYNWPKLATLRCWIEISFALWKLMIFLILLKYDFMPFIYKTYIVVEHQIEILWMILSKVIHMMDNYLPCQNLLWSLCGECGWSIFSKPCHALSCLVTGRWGSCDKIRPPGAPHTCMRHQVLDTSCW